MESQFLFCCCGVPCPMSLLAPKCSLPIVLITITTQYGSSPGTPCLEYIPPLFSCKGSVGNTIESSAAINNDRVYATSSLPNAFKSSPPSKVSFAFGKTEHRVTAYPHEAGL